MYIIGNSPVLAKQYFFKYGHFWLLDISETIYEWVKKKFANSASMTSSQLNSSDDDHRKTLNFSIEHILHKAGNQEIPADTQEGCRIPTGNLPYVPFPWLHCTRYCPPKVPRNQRREAPQKRQLGRHPRIPFTTHQLTVLEEKFKQSPYLSSQEVKDVSRKLDLADIRVKIWFQNRRARERREKSFIREDPSDRKESSKDVASNTIQYPTPLITNMSSESWDTKIETASLCEISSNQHLTRNINDFFPIMKS